MEKMMSSKKSITNLMIPWTLIPVKEESSSLKEALDEMTKKNLGVCIFTNPARELLGILTDGDLRRLILKHQEPLPSLLVRNAIFFGTKSPFSINTFDSVEKAIQVMDKEKIWDLPVTDSGNQIVGLLNRHNLNNLS
jgi:CBS domain-containing protein